MKPVTGKIVATLFVTINLVILSMLIPPLWLAFPIGGVVLVVRAIRRRRRYRAAAPYRAEAAHDAQIARMAAAVESL